MRGADQEKATALDDAEEKSKTQKKAGWLKNAAIAKIEGRMEVASKEARAQAFESGQAS